MRTLADFMLDCFSVLEEQQEEVIRAMSENSPFFTKRDVIDRLHLIAA